MVLSESFCRIQIRGLRREVIEAKSFIGGEERCQRLAQWLADLEQYYTENHPCELGDLTLDECLDAREYGSLREWALKLLAEMNDAEE